MIEVPNSSAGTIVNSENQVNSVNHVNSVNNVDSVNNVNSVNSIRLKQCKSRCYLHI